MKLLIPALFLAPAAFVAAEPPSLPAAAEQGLQTIEREYLPQHLKQLAQATGRKYLRQLAAGYRELIRAYREDGNVEMRLDSGETLLQLACAAGQEALIRELLAAGADPRNPFNRRALEDLFFCYRISNDVRLRCIEMLVAAGAELRGVAGQRAFACACMSFPCNDTLALRLMDLGADPFTDEVTEDEHIELLLQVIYRGWPRVLERLLHRDLPEGWQEKSLPILFILIENSSLLRDGATEWEPLARCICLLLQHGIDPQSRMVASDDKDSSMQASLADALHESPRLLAYLRGRGIDITSTPRPLRRESLAQDVLALGRAFSGEFPEFHPPTSSLRALRTELEQLVNNPPPLDAPNDAAALRTMTLCFLNQVDAARTTSLVTALPDWKNPVRAEVLVRQLASCRHLRLPSEFIIEQAQACAEQAQILTAHELVGMIERNAGALATVERLCESPHDCIAAAAWRIRLDLNGLDSVREAESLHPQLRRLQVERIRLGLHLPARNAAPEMAATVLNTEALQAEGSIRLLRQQGKTAAAGHLSDITTLWQELRRPDITPQRSIRPHPERQQLLAMLMERLSPDALRATAYAFDIALSRYIWEHRRELQRHIRLQPY